MYCPYRYTAEYEEVFSENCGAYEEVFSDVWRDWIKVQVQRMLRLDIAVFACLKQRCWLIPSHVR